jgi:hypothetical protein
MRFTFSALLLGTASSFSPVMIHNGGSRTPISLRNSDTHVEREFTADSGMNVDNLPLFIDNLNVENFEESLEIFEALFTNECVGDTCEDYINQLKEKAKTIGKELPPGFGSKHH